jgi:sigma-B regulation protein RsbU (phosphoserine phosphatase)
MRISFFHSLPVRLAGLILLLSGLTLLGLTELNRRAVERILIEQAEVQAAIATNAVVDGLDAVIGGAERLAKFIARDLEGRTLVTSEVERIARNAVSDHPSVFGVSIAFQPRVLAGGTERFGTYVHRTNAVSRFATRDLATPEQAYWERDWYREAIDKGMAVWSEPFFDQGGTDKNVVRLAVPFFRATTGDEREPAGVVAAVIELDWLRRLANTNEFSDTSYAIIFSRTGKLIIHPKANYVIAETIETLAEKTSAPDLPKLRQNVIAKRQGSLSYTEVPSGRRVHVNYKPTKFAGWGVIVGYDEAEFLKNQRAFRRLAALYLGATLFLLAGIVIGITRYALRPLGALATAADEIAQRNLDCVIAEPARADEVGHLTGAFRAMRDALKAQHLERRWASQSLEHQLKYNQLIIDSIGELVFVLTKAMNISRINPAVTRVTELTATDVIKTPLARVVQLGAGAPVAAGGGDLLAETLKAGRSLHDVAAVVLTKDGRHREARLTLVPLHDANRVVGGVVTLRLESPVPPSA